TGGAGPSTAETSGMGGADAMAGTGGGGGGIVVDKSCMVAWAKSFAAQGGLDDGAVATDAAHNVIFTSFTDFDSIDFGGGPVYGEHGFFIGKLDQSGYYLAAVALNGAPPTAGSSIYVAPDAAGNILVGGTFPTALYFGDVWLTTKGSTDGFVAKFD